MKPLTGKDLDRMVEDHLGFIRSDGESDEQLRARAQFYMTDGSLGSQFIDSANEINRQIEAIYKSMSIVSEDPEMEVYAEVFGWE